MSKQRPDPFFDLSRVEARYLVQCSAQTCVPHRLLVLRALIGVRAAVAAVRRGCAASHSQRARARGLCALCASVFACPVPVVVRWWCVYVRAQTSKCCTRVYSRVCVRVCAHVCIRTHARHC